MKMRYLAPILALNLTNLGYGSQTFVDETQHTLPGSAIFDINGPIRTDFKRENLETMLADADATEEEKHRLLEGSNVVYDADVTKSADLKFTTIKFGEREDPDQSPERYGKSLDALGGTMLYILPKRFNQVTLEDLTNAEATGPGLYTIPFDSAHTGPNTPSIERYNLIWLEAQGPSKRELNYIPLSNARNTENNLNYLPEGTTVGIVTNQEGKKEYFKLEITGQNDLGHQGDGLYFNNWSTSFKVENLSKK